MEIETAFRATVTFNQDVFIAGIAASIIIHFLLVDGQVMAVAVMLDVIAIIFAEIE